MGFAGLQAGEPAAPGMDVLVYKDGDRVRGRVVSEADGVIVFVSERFGELWVPAAEAQVIRAPVAVAAAATPAATEPAAEPAPGGKPAKPAEPESEEVAAVREAAAARFSTALLTAKLRDFFGPWKGRLAVSTEIVSDTADRSSLSVEAKLSRKWAKDEVQLNGRYDFAQTNDVTTTDMIKADGLWRHNFSKTTFVQYRPLLEWNRARYRAGLPADYVLLQQEFGAGVSLVSTAKRKLRVGVSENLFDVWTTSPPVSHNSRGAESAFVETELKLPWALLLTDRGVYYHSFSSGNAGWENRVELTKKFTEALSTAIRHETRQGSPDGTAQDYTRLKLLVGLDF